jgi:hypothetical protein
MGRQGKVSSAHLTSNSSAEMSQIAPTCHFLPGPKWEIPCEQTKAHLSVVSRQLREVYPQVLLGSSKVFFLPLDRPYHAIQIDLKTHYQIIS